jgi:hypothetical protein
VQLTGAALGDDVETLWLRVGEIGSGELYVPRLERLT